MHELNNNIRGFIKIILYFGIMTGIYFSTIPWLLRNWSRDDYTYCYLIPLIVLYLIWEKRKELISLPFLPSWKGMFFLIPGILLFWLGELAGEYFTMYISFWLALVGICWLHLGWKKLKVIAFPLVFMLTMFPPPNFIYQKISVALKLISSQLGVAMMQFFGMSVFREGNVIDLGFTQLQVVDACSGLRYLIPLIVLGILLAYFFRGSLWKKMVIVLTTIPLSILTNGLRIGLTGLLYESWGPKVAEGFFHGFSGWFIFMFSLGVLLLEMWVLNKVGAKGKRQKAKGEDSIIDRPPLAVSRLFSSHFIVAIVLLGATLALSFGIEFREKIPITKSFDQFPLKVGKWTGTREYMEQKFVDSLDLSDYVIIDYKNGDGRHVNFYIAYYESQRKGESIHSPATCLPGSGWIFKQAGTKNIPMSYDGSSFMPVNRAFMQKSGYRQLSYYWFPQRGRILTNAYQLKLYVFWDALTRQRTDGALVRVITLVHELEDLNRAEARLRNFVREIVPVLSEFIPE